MSDWVNVASVTEFLPGTCRTLEVDGTMIAVFNLNGQFHAIEDICTHDGGELASGVLDGDTIICPRHGACFSIKTGEALSAPAYEAVTCFPVRVESGVVQVRDHRWN